MNTRGKKVNARGINFLENWIDGNVTEADKYGSHERAKELAVKCLAEAKAMGITTDNMGSEPDSLEKIIYEAMHHGFDG
jgi:D-tyrosyl-tRNA(Tyr) deacylase